REIRPRQLDHDPVRRLHRPLRQLSPDREGLELHGASLPAACAGPGRKLEVPGGAADRLKFTSTFPIGRSSIMAAKQPNILIIWGDDIGWFNISVYNHGVMGYRTLNIDRLAKEGT